MHNLPLNMGNTYFLNVQIKMASKVAELVSAPCDEKALTEEIRSYLDDYETKGSCSSADYFKLQIDALKSRYHFFWIMYS